MFSVIEIRLVNWKDEQNLSNRGLDLQMAFFFDRIVRLKDKNAELDFPRPSSKTKNVSAILYGRK